MRRIFTRLIWLTFGALLVVVLLECILRLLPVSMGRHRTDQFERWPLQNLEPRLPYAYSISWAMLNAQRGVTNNYGHIAPFDYRKGSHPILVIGDSFIESLMNDYADTLQGQLSRKIDTLNPVYGLGVSGLSASDYLALSRLARDEFSPVAAVFLITDGDFSESLGARLGNYFLVPNGDELKLGYAPMKGKSAFKKIRESIGDIAIYRYFQANLQFSLDNVVKVFRHAPVSNVGSGRAVNDVRRQRQVADWLLAELPAGLRLAPECIVFLMDSDRYALYKPDLASARKDSPEVRRHFIERAQKLGFKVSDLDSVFRKRYAQDQTKFDHWPIDRHWNRIGHGIGAEEAYQLLFTLGQRPLSCLTTNRVEN